MIASLMRPSEARSNAANMGAVLISRNFTAPVVAQCLKSAARKSRSNPAAT